MPLSNIDSDEEAEVEAEGEREAEAEGEREREREEEREVEHDANVDSFSDLSSFIPNPHTFYASTDHQPEPNPPDSAYFHKSHSQSLQGLDRRAVQPDPWAGALDDSLWSSSSSSKISYRTRSDSHNTALSGQDVVSPVNSQGIWATHSDAPSSGSFGLGLGLFLAPNDSYESSHPSGKASAFGLGPPPLLASPSSSAKKSDLWDLPLVGREHNEAHNTAVTAFPEQPHPTYGIHASFAHSPGIGLRALDDAERAVRSQSLKSSPYLAYEANVPVSYPSSSAPHSAFQHGLGSHVTHGRLDSFASQTPGLFSNSYSQSHLNQASLSAHGAHANTIHGSLDYVGLAGLEKEGVSEIDHSFVYSPVDSPHFSKSSFMENSASSSPSMSFSPRDASLSFGQYNHHQYQTFLQQQNASRGTGMGFNQGQPSSWLSQADRVSSLHSGNHQYGDNRPRSRSGGLPQFNGSYGVRDESLLTKLQNIRISPNVKSPHAFSHSPTPGRFGISPKTGSLFGSAHDSSVNQMTSLLPLHDANAAYSLHIHLMDTSDFVYGANAILYCDVEFKASRKETFMYPSGHSLSVSDFVIVEADRGQDLGRVARLHAQGYTPKSSSSSANTSSVAGTTPTTEPTLMSGKGTPGLQSHILQADGFDMDGFAAYGDAAPQTNSAPKKIIRRAYSKEIQQLSLKASEEHKALLTCQTKVKHRSLPMEVIDAEYQFDRKKLTYYFKAEHRIDFRELVRDLFRIFKTRIWLKQTDGRQGRQVISYGDTQ